MRTATAATGSAFLFRPDTVVRARWDNTQDTPLPPEMVVGENPPEGAVLDYYLPAAATGTVTLTITGGNGDVLREYSSVPPPADTTMANVPEYWLAPPAVLPTGAGMHRVSWDLRYPDPPTLNYGYSGNPLDYREYTLSWHAIPGKTPHSTLVGPMVLPGTYTAKLTVNGKSYTQPITVVPDPRVKLPAAALEAQFKLQQRMVAGIRATYDAVRYIQALRVALRPGSGARDDVIKEKPLHNALDERSSSQRHELLGHVTTESRSRTSGGNDDQHTLGIGRHAQRSLAGAIAKWMAASTARPRNLATP